MGTAASLFIGDKGINALLITVNTNLFPQGTV